MREHLPRIFTGLVMLAVLLAFIYSCTACAKPQIQVNPSVPSKEADVTALIDRTVKIYANCEDGNGTGSGVIWSSDADMGAKVATADHVVNGTNCLFFVERATGEMSPVYDVQHDPRHDVAVLSVDVPWVYEPLSVSPPGLGQDVLAIGFPWDYLKRKTWLTVSRGHVIALYELDSDEAYRITAHILPGSSGGPCWSLDGGLIGLTVSYWQSDGIPFDGHYYVTSAAWIDTLLSGSPAYKKQQPQK